MIEAIIERMAKNSFQLKGWSMTLIALVGAISAQGSDKRFILLAFIPILGFWILDSFYLQQERKYKQLYKNVAEQDESQIDFNLDADKATGTAEEMARLCFCKCLFSITELCFYPLIAVALIILVIVLKVF
ncbi:hypothetical protein DW776_06110 [Ruminococcus sp. AM30-15AC]|jgi:hypothetical protein|nr:hypothetical protein DXD97_00725 [Ruminococcus sp. TM10-9AT]RHD94414.1 hypothetical protein DW776_06110 [Ruminococcus sp. AM30-15AC]RHS65276.1 hypothetical protein DW955_00315 [Ruminococcus sp. AM45-9BH]RHS78333.1 hypothetical protein DW953_01190 [Ruminococcus sp. AM45-2]